MAGEHNLCYSPDGDNLTFNRTNKQLIYKKGVEPPQPPSIYGDVYVIASVRPSYIEGEPIEGYEQYTDWRMAAQLIITGATGGDPGFGFPPRTAICNLYNSPVAGSLYATAYGLGTYLQAISFYVDVLIVQPSSGIQFSFSLSAVIQDYNVYHNRWAIAIYGNSSRLLTNATITPDW